MTVLPPDPYKILGVSKDAQLPEIRAAHRKLVLKCHPDKIQDPALKEAKQIEFQQVQQAYELLSNEIDREKYDQKAEFYAREQWERERAKSAAARAASSAPKQEPAYFNVNIKDASPRASTFAKSSPFGTPSRSYEDGASGAPLYEEFRHARKTASYEKEKPSKRDEERRRRKEDEEWREKEKQREARKQRERKEEKDRVAREEREKEKRKEEKKKAQSSREKERGKERKSATTDKHRSRHSPIVEEDSDSSDSSDEDVIYEAPPKPDRKKSSSGQKPEDIDPPTATSERTRKYSGNMENAIQYLTRSGGKLAVGSFVRSATFTEGSKLYATPMVPTPPPAAAAPFAPPPPQVGEPGEISDDDDVVRRSSGRPSRRMSHDTPKSSREKPSSHKKSSSSRDHQPIIIDASPRNIPSMARAQTEAYAHAIPIPGLRRAETWYPATDRERERHHERSRSRQMFSEDEHSEDDRERRRRRGGKRTQSPEPMRYSVEGTKSIPIRQKQYHEQPPRNAYKSKGGAYVMPNSSARRGHATSYSRDYYEEPRPQQQYSDIKFAAQFHERDVRYSTYQQPDIYA
ncbi:hypothetical protein SAMD00023353_5900210 [Rosellinia necatrix]|uniref:J domain-containing protein n=1 Tax=Rosellinia necatrix TaxID=77044 RepID=A0A1W2TVG5_ROSNE|nr:hypothetical protein SAMD00023353_5900210 [Rosellinia necatrix]